MAKFSEGLIWEPAMVSLLQKASMNEPLECTRKTVALFYWLCECGFITEEAHRMALTEKGRKVLVDLGLTTNSFQECKYGF